MISVPGGGRAGLQGGDGSNVDARAPAFRLHGLVPLAVLPTHRDHKLTICHSATSPYTMEVGMHWFAVAITLIVIYTVAIRRAFWG